MLAVAQAETGVPDRIGHGRSIRPEAGAGVSRLRVQCRPPTVSHTVFHGAVVVVLACVGVGVSRHQCGFGVCQVVACLVKACHCVALVVVVVVVVSVSDRPRNLGCFASVALPVGVAKCGFVADGDQCDDEESSHVSLPFEVVLCCMSVIIGCHRHNASVKPTLRHLISHFVKVFIVAYTMPIRYIPRYIYALHSVRITLSIVRN